VRWKLLRLRTRQTLACVAWLVAVAPLLAGCGPRTITAVMPINPAEEDSVISIVDSTGWVRTVAVADTTGADLDTPDDVIVWNPAGDATRLRVAWGAGPCLANATIAMRLVGSLRLDVTSGEELCSEDMLRRYVLELAFDREIPAGSVIARDLTPPD
jgi:hypothetical protein